MTTSNRPRLCTEICRPRRSTGVTLVIVMILLVILSILGVLSVRNATSSEAVSGNVRLSQLASQSAETALRYCEDAVVNFVNGGTATYNLTTPANTATASLTAAMIVDYAAGTPTSVQTSNWDSNTTSTVLLIVPTSVVNPTVTLFMRPPECMVERLSPSYAPTYTSSFAITSRGFGPEVAADTARARPQGSEVFMQSTIELQ